MNVLAKKYRSAPKVETFISSGIKIKCEPELIRALWKSQTKLEVFQLYPPLACSSAPLFLLRKLAICQAAGFSRVIAIGQLFVGRNNSRIWQPPIVYILDAPDDEQTIAFIGNALKIGTVGKIKSLIFFPHIKGKK